MEADKCVLLCGDCLELMTDVTDNSIDMILCDLPYGTTRCKWDDVIPFAPLWKQYRRIIKEDGAIVLFSAEPFTSSLVMSNPKMFRYDLIWQKDQGTDFLNANRKPLGIHENICVFYKKQPTYNKQYWYSTPYKPCNVHEGTDVFNDFKLGYFKGSDGERNPTTVLQFNRERGLHPTQKPIALLEWLIKTYTNEGQVVLDNCMGSGSTGVACVNTNRRFLGIELDNGYFNIAKQRIDDALSNKERQEIGD